MYIAIDGGGTKTEYLLLDEFFQIKDRFLGKCVNHDFLPDGWEGTGKELKNGIFTLLEKNGLQIEELRDVTAGLSGIDTRIDQQRIETCMKKIGVPDFAVCNDGFLPVMAECRDGWGIAYNCGTGVCCAGIDEKKNRVKTAGLDEWSGDAGGGSWIALHMFRQVYGDLFYQQKETPFAQKYMEKLQLRTKEDFLDSIFQIRYPREYPQVQKQVIQLLFELLEEGDEEANFIADKMLQCAYVNIRAVIEGLDFSEKKIPLVLTGSIHTKAANQEYLRRLYAGLQNMTEHSLSIQMAQRAPVYGAVRWLEERNKI